MSEYTPITGELRKYEALLHDDGSAALARIGEFCDAIDAVHAQLERENAALKAELDRVLGEQEEHAHTRGESITGELREVAAKTECANGRCEKLYRGDLERIADRIDAEHQKALDEWKAKHGQMWLKGYSECHAELLEGNETLASDLERCGWIRLPKDADGDHIHVGDVLDGYGKTIEVVELRYGRSGWVLISRDGNGYADTFAFTHHAPTVEDVLREFANEVYADADNEIRDRDFLCAKYAKRLTLAEGVDE